MRNTSTSPFPMDALANVSLLISASSTAEPSSSGAEHPQRSIAETIEILIYGICLCVGGPLNLISFRRLLANFQMAGNSLAAKSGSQIALLKLHLNIADLLTMFIYTLSQIIWMITFQWYAGDLLCRICKFFHTFGFYLNSFVVACFAIDRLLGTYNLNNLRSGNLAYVRVKRMLVLAWIFAFLLSLPQCFIFRVFEPPELGNFKQCTPVWTIIGYEIDVELGALSASAEVLSATERDQIARQRDVLLDRFHRVLSLERVYNVAHLLFVFWIPTLIIVASYGTILCILNSFSVPETIRRTGTSIRAPIRHALNYTASRRRLYNGSCRANCSVAADQSTGTENSSARKDVGDGGGVESTANFAPDESCGLLGVENGHCPQKKKSSLVLSTDRSNVRRKELQNGGTHFSATRSLKVRVERNSGDSLEDEDRVSDEDPIKRLSMVCNMATNIGQQLSSDKADANDGGNCSGAVNAIRGSSGSCIGPMALQTIARARQTAKRQAALILLAYLTFWSPYNLLAVANAFSAKDGAIREMASTILPFLNSMIVMNPIVNPLIYDVFRRRRKE